MTDFDPEYPHTLMIHFPDSGQVIRGCRLSQGEDAPHIYTLGMTEDAFWILHNACMRRARSLKQRGPTYSEDAPCGHCGGERHKYDTFQIGGILACHKCWAKDQVENL